MMPSEQTRTVSALGVVEIFAWGSTYYLMAVLAGPMAADTGWSAGLISAGVSVGLLVSGLAAPRSGGSSRRPAAGKCCRRAWSWSPPASSSSPARSRSARGIAFEK